MGITFYFDWEVSLMETIQSYMGDFASKVAGFCSVFGEQAILLLVFGFFYWCKNKEYGKQIAISMIVSLLSCCILKGCFARRRPYFDNEGIKCIRPVHPSSDIYDIAIQGYSFPSMHSANAASIYTSVALYIRKKPVTFLMIAVILSVALSRVCVGVHYPTDVICGLTVGVVSVFLMQYIMGKVKDKRKVYLAIFILFLPGFLICTNEDFYNSFGLMTGTFLGICFEEKYVHFENTRKPLNMVLRLAGGMLVLVVMNSLLKMMLAGALMDAEVMTGHIIRIVRYTIVLFTAVGIYPMLFKKLKI